MYLIIDMDNKSVESRRQTAIKQSLQMVKCHDESWMSIMVVTNEFCGHQIVLRQSDRFHMFCE